MEPTINALINVIWLLYEPVFFSYYFNFISIRIYYLTFGRATGRALGYFHISLILINFAGTPATICIEGTSFVTTEPAPITQPLPRVTPGIITEFAPIHTSSSITIFFRTMVSFILES